MEFFAGTLASIDPGEPLDEHRRVGRARTRDRISVRADGRTSETVARDAIRIVYVNAAAPEVFAGAFPI